MQINDSNQRGSTNSEPITTHSKIRVYKYSSSHKSKFLLDVCDSVQVQCLQSTDSTSDIGISVFNDE